MALGNLTVRLGLDAAEFIGGLDKADAKAQKFAKQQEANSRSIDRQVKALQDQAAVVGRSERQTKLFELAQKGANKAQLDSANAALRQKEAFELGQKIGNTLRNTLIGLGAASVAAGVLFEKLVGDAAKFQDLAEKTGASAETLASFKTAADVSATSLDTVAAASVKLTKGLAGADEETAGAANAIKQLGFNLKDFQQLDPGAQFEAIAKRLGEFEDGAGKTAFAVAAFGKAGAEALPFLKELGGQTGRQIILTAEQIRLADDYKDAQARLTSQVEQYAQRLAIEVLPTVLDFKKALFETAQEIIGVDKNAAKLGQNNSVKDFAESAAKALGFVIDAGDGVSRTFQVVATTIAGVAAIPVGQGLAPMKRAIADIGDQIDRILSRETFGTKLERTFAQRAAALAAEANAFESGFPASSKPVLDRNKFGTRGDNGAKAVAEAKKRLDQQLSDLDNFVRSEDRILQSREAALERHYQNDQLSIKAYFDARTAALDLNAQATVAAFDKQIAALEAFAKKSKSTTDKIEAQTKIGDVQEKRTELQIKRASEQQKIDDDRKRAAQAYADQVDELRAKVLELSNTENAAAQAALIRFDIQNRALRARATAEGDTLAVNNIEQLRRQTDSQARFNSLLQDAGVIEEQLGTIEARLNLERSLGMRGELSTLDALGKAHAASIPDLERIAERYRQIGIEFEDPRLIQAADRLTLKIKDLGLTTDLLGDKFRDVFQSSFVDAFASFIDGTTSAKEAFKAFADDIVRQINRIAAQEIAISLFGKGGANGQGAGWLSGLIPLIAGLFGGGAAPGSLGSGNYGMNVRANGGPVAANQPYIVGERGPELFMPKRSGVIVPNHQMNGSSRPITVTNHFTIEGQVTRATQNQIAAEAGRAIAIASRRLN